MNANMRGDFGGDSEHGNAFKRLFAESPLFAEGSVPEFDETPELLDLSNNRQIQGYVRSVEENTLRLVRQLDELRRSIDTESDATNLLGLAEGLPVEFDDSGNVVLEVPAPNEELHQRTRRKSVEMHAFGQLCRDDVSRTVVTALEIINNRIGSLVKMAQHVSNSSEWHEIRKMQTIFDVLFHRVAVSLGYLGKAPNYYSEYVKSRLLIMKSGIRTIVDVEAVFEEHKEITECVKNQDMFGVRLAVDKHLAASNLRWESTNDYRYRLEVERLPAAANAWDPALLEHAGDVSSESDSGGHKGAAESKPEYNPIPHDGGLYAANGPPADFPF